ncbi:MAG: ArgE/DapE family deacylase [Hyphomicrobiaceae bacterium]|nr:ArgE/DapE family deacylase [Hyphomicrobiaceae bacterium]
MDQNLETAFAAIDAAIEAARDRQVAWLRTLASFDSTRGNERACQNWLADEFRKRGLEVDSFAISDVDISGLPGSSPVVDADYENAIQVVATHRPGSIQGKSLILQGHIDVVPPGPLDQWKHDPFEPQVSGKAMTGRGVNDMKTGVAQMVFAFDAIQAAGFEPAGIIHFETVSEEECTGNGALATLARGYVADACLIPESLDDKLVRAQLGSVWFRLRTRGRSAHLMDAAASVSAIFAAEDYIAAFQDLAATYNSRAATSVHYAHIDKPIGFSVGKIAGGDWVGSVPAWCDMDCRINVLEGLTCADVQRDIVAVAASVAEKLGVPAPDVEWIGFHAEPYVLEPGSVAEAVLGAAHRDVFGTDLATFSLTATSDVRQYGLYYGIPALCYGGCGGGSHSVDEWTDLDSMVRTTRVIARFIAGWCGLSRD